MKILFCAAHFSCFRNFESVVCALAERGHDVHLTADERESMGGEGLVRSLAARYPTVSWAFAPSAGVERWYKLALNLRLGLEYVRFLDPKYDRFPKYRDRTARRAPRAFLWASALGMFRRGWARRLAASALVALERATPTSAVLDAFIAEQQPDVLLLGSATNPGSPQLDHLKSARKLGIRTAACVLSWDHLSGKAWLRIPPDQVIVWNDVQKEEAVDLHNIPSGRVIVTGAQCYDHWFEWQPTRSREEFCRQVGLAPDRPFLLYVCSVFVRPSPSEPEFVVRWSQRIRACRDPRLREAGILIRPHPERLDEWRGIDLSSLDNVALHGRNPVDSEAKADYFHSMYYSAAVAGISTTAFLEAAIVGRAIYAIRAPEFRIHQEGSPHFQYLLNVGGGLLHLADDYDEHLAQLADALSRPSARGEENRRFLQAFVRPLGLDTPATPRFVETVEHLAQSPAIEPEVLARESAPAALTFSFLRLCSRAPILKHLFTSSRDAAEERALRDRARQEQAIKESLRAEATRRQSEKARTKQAELERKAVLRQEKARVVAQRAAERAAVEREKMRRVTRARLVTFVKRFLSVND